MNNKDLQISSDILHDRKLSSKQKYYLAMFRAWGEKEADSEYLVTYTKFSLANTKKALKNKCYIIYKKLNEIELKQLVLENKNTGGVCEWCGCKTSALQKHHYPIARKDGGKEVANICPNCHYEYHLFERENKKWTF